MALIDWIVTRSLANCQCKLVLGVSVSLSVSICSSEGLSVRESPSLFPLLGVRRFHGGEADTKAQLASLRESAMVKLEEEDLVVAMRSLESASEKLGRDGTEEARPTWHDVE